MIPVGRAMEMVKKQSFNIVFTIGAHGDGQFLALPHLCPCDHPPMKVILQRVKRASVEVDRQIVGQINEGLLVLFGAQKGDSAHPEHLDWLVNKISGLRIFHDDEGKMNRSVMDIDGEVLVVSQFTLFAQTKKGFRPSFVEAAPPDEAIPLYESFVDSLSKKLGKTVPTGRFGADMDVSLVNHGPVTISIDSHQRS